MKTKELIISGIGVVSAIYLLNLGFGVVEIIPDLTPFFGNADEFVASLFVLATLKYIGFDVQEYLE